MGRQWKRPRGGPCAAPSPKRPRRLDTSDPSGKFKKDDPECDPNEFFEWMINPISSNEFFDHYWEKKPLFIRRNENKQFYDGWFTKADLDRLLRTSIIKYGVNLDVVKCIDGKRQTFTPTGRAYPASVWDFFEDGCSLRLLNPQTFREPIWRMLSILQEFFQSGMGANIYLTPANTQGFQVHYDDIEAFVLQLEGSKRWRVYPPRSAGETLPKYSSRNFDENEVGTPILDTVLHAGDMLYFPRGWIHQANATEEDSVHITVSTYQDWSWGTYLEKAVQRAVQIAFENDPKYREGLPRGFLDYMGQCHEDRADPRREKFIGKAEELIAGLNEYLPLDAAADHLGVRFLEDSYPPALSAKEISQTAAAGTRTERGEDSQEGDHLIDEHSQVRVVRPCVARIVNEGELVVVYHSLENGRIYHVDPPAKLEFPAACLDVLQYFLCAWPEYVRVGDAPGFEEDEELLAVAVALYDFGLLAKRPTQKR